MGSPGNVEAQCVRSVVQSLQHIPLLHHCMGGVDGEKKESGCHATGVLWPEPQPLGYACLISVCLEYTDTTNINSLPVAAGD